MLNLTTEQLLFCSWKDLRVRARDFLHCAPDCTLRDLDHGFDNFQVSYFNLVDATCHEQCEGKILLKMVGMAYMTHEKEKVEWAQSHGDGGMRACFTLWSNRGYIETDTEFERIWKEMVAEENQGLQAASPAPSPDLDSE